MLGKEDGSGGSWDEDDENRALDEYEGSVDERWLVSNNRVERLEHLAGSAGVELKLLEDLPDQDSKVYLIKAQTVQDFIAFKALWDKNRWVNTED